MPQNPKDGKLQVRTVRFLPQDLETEPSFPSDLKVTPELGVTLSNLFGQSDNAGVLIGAFPWNALKVSTYGAGFRLYDVVSGTAPSAFSASHELTATAGYFHRFDVLVESADAEIRFYQESSAVWGDAIPLNVGYHSIEFSSSKIQVKARTASVGTYTLVGFQ